MSTAKKKPARKPRSGGVIYIRGAGDLAKRLDEWKENLNSRGGGIWTRERLALVILQNAVKDRAPDGQP